MELLRAAFAGDDEMFEAVIQEWIRQHLNYLRWYATAISDVSIPLSEILKPPVVCYRPWRKSKDQLDFVRFGRIFKLLECYRREECRI